MRRKKDKANETVVVASRIPARMLEDLNTLMVELGYLNISDFIRDVLREKLEQELRRGRSGSR